MATAKNDNMEIFLNIYTLIWFVLIANYKSIIYKFFRLQEFYEFLNIGDFHSIRLEILKYIIFGTYLMFIWFISMLPAVLLSIYI